MPQFVGDFWFLAPFASGHDDEDPIADLMGAFDVALVSFLVVFLSLP